MHDLNAYQSEIARAVVDSVLRERGLTFTVEIARGGGVRLLKIGPASKPPTNERLVSHLTTGTPAGLWSIAGSSVSLGRSTVQSITTDDLGLAVVEHSIRAAGLIEVVDVQLIEPEIFDRWIDPAIESSGATTVLYGIPLNGESRFECLKQRNRELEAADGIQRHFRVPWECVADTIPGYAVRVDEARGQLGEEHPEFQTAYCLRPVAASGPLLSEDQRGRLQAGPAREHAPRRGDYVATIVVTRAPQTGDEALPILLSSTAATAIVVVEHRWVQAIDAPSLAKRIGTLLAETWRCSRVVAQHRAAAGGDETRLRHLLQAALGHIPMQWVADADTAASPMALDLLAAVNTHRMALYPADATPESHTLGHELRTAVATRRGDGLTHVSVPSGGEGFLRGVLLLTGFAGPATHSATEEPETALAS